MGIRKDSVSEKIYQDNLPKGWIKIEFKKIIKNIPITNKKLKQKEYQEKGILPVIDQGQKFIGGFTDKIKLKVNCDLPVIIFGDHTKTIKFLNQEFVAGADGIKILKPKTTLNTKLIYFFIQAISLPDKGYARHYQYLTKSIISIPPLNEQKRIVTKIESIFAQIDATKEKLETLALQKKSASASLNMLRSSILKQAFEGKLVPQDPNDEPAEILLRRIHKDSKDLIERDDNLPKGWIYVRIKDIVNNPKQNIVDGPFGSNLKSSEYVNYGIPLIRLQNVERNHFIDKNTKYITKEKAEELKRHNFLQNDIVITKLGFPVGKACIVPYFLKSGIIVADIIRIRMSDEFVLKKILTYMINSNIIIQQFAKHTKGTTRPRVNLTKFRDFQIPLPPLNEQKRIVTKIESIFAEIDAKQKELEKLEIQLKSIPDSISMLKSSILKMAFEGKLVPQDPNDESASMLLEKINSQKS